VIEESQPVAIASSLSKNGIEVMVYDPAAMENAKKVLTEKVKYASSLKEALEWGEAIVIATPWSEFAKIKVGELKKENNLLVVDCWRILDAEEARKTVEYLTPGINPGF
jgi:UDPglucose 6-dehydrogenase